MTIYVNAAFSRRNHPLRPRGLNKRRTERQIVTDMGFDVETFSEITKEMVTRHPMALPAHAGWELQAFSSKDAPK